MKQTKVLDHGYVALVESWGSDERIIEAARMSTGKGFLGWGPLCQKCGLTGEYLRVARCSQAESGVHVTEPGDEKLLAFLWQNKHATPFEMAGATVEIQAPIFVFREWHRHRAQSYNEMSARYAPLPDLNYIPTVERLMLNASAGGKQAGAATGAQPLTMNAAEFFQRELARVYNEAESLYQEALKAGVPKELARVHLPVGRYSRMRTSANLRNWLAFLALRSTAKNPAAQWEIPQYADVVHEMLAEAFPRTLELFDGPGQASAPR